MHATIGMPRSWLEGLKIYHVIQVAGSARLAGPTLSRHQTFPSEQNGSPEGRFFSFSLTRERLLDHKAT